jgi:hypothetical protein
VERIVLQPRSHDKSNATKRSSKLKPAGALKNPNNPEKYSLYSKLKNVAQHHGTISSRSRHTNAAKTDLTLHHSHGNEQDPDSTRQQHIKILDMDTLKGAI